MINMGFRPYNGSNPIQKSILYKINESCTIEFIEQHKEGREIVYVEYLLQEEQYGIYGNEYRRPGTLKEGGKVADVLACVVDEDKKVIKSLIFDVKSNISAFSDDLSKTVAVLVATKEVRDFVEQIHAEILHKESFLLYYKDAGYIEQENVGIVTTNFEAHKFREVAERLEKIISEEKKDIPQLVYYKAMNRLKPYESQIEILRNFADKKLKIGNKIYQMKVFLLKQTDSMDYITTIRLAS